ncbi:MAG: hypothetical protein F6K22_14755 [Okeania sp. SIO2F4]|uniref:hypothetical protein n=1 Tax=Okeania sp. SIO2F4 TaxID=2607790 RepID=UPI00142AB97C|nr:hypothetical protein [Okeania sp. SIO2F4]NES03983.1 hypothetical protein [Okeania sp. SIO2F4]
MTTLIFTMLCYSATSYLFSGSICYLANQSDVKKQKETVKNKPSQINLGIILLWPLWIFKGINQEEKVINLRELTQENHIKKQNTTKYFQHKKIDKPIGEVLQDAGLMTDSQVKEILQYQTGNRHLKFGEIAVMWRIIKQETVDFFVDIFPQLITENNKKPVGEYLKLANLLNEEQIYSILIEQNQTNLRFGEVAVQKGWLRQETIDFVLQYLKGEFTPVVEN